MLPLFFIYVIWGVWALLFSIAALWPAYSVRKLKLWEEFLYRLFCFGAAALLLTITPWPGLDVQYSLWDRMPEGAVAWRLVAVAAAGVAIAIWAQIQRLIVLHSRPKLVTTGPYRILRHPLYAGLTIAIFATALLFGRPSSFLGAVLLTAAFCTKAVLDERRSKGPEFEAYRQRTMAVVPILGLLLFEIRRRLARSGLFARYQERASLLTAPAPRTPPGSTTAPSLRVTTVPVVLVLNEEAERSSP